MLSRTLIKRFQGVIVSKYNIKLSNISYRGIAQAAQDDNHAKIMDESSDDETGDEDRFIGMYYMYAYIYLYMFCFVFN